MSDVPVSSVSCPRCQGEMQLVVEDDGSQVVESEVCACGYVFMWAPQPVDAPGIRAAVAEVRKRPIYVLGASCRRRAHGSCSSYGCPCPCHWLVAA